MKRNGFLVGIALLLLILPACATRVSRTVTPATPVPTHSPTPSQQVKPTPIPSTVATPQLTATPEPAPAPTSTPAPTTTPTPAPKPSPLPERDNSELPHVFIGKITIGGNPAPNGTEVSVWLPEFKEPIGTGMYSAGAYLVYAHQHGSKSFGGRSLIFKINDQDSGETSTWIKGMATALDLSLD